MKRRLAKVGVFLLLGMATSTLLAWGLAFSMPRPGQLRSARAIIDDRPWHLSVWTGRGWTIVRGGLPVVQAWSAWQATGPPDTPGFGDLRTAWASKTPDGQVEWMRLRYPRPITPRGVEVHETYNPGAVTRISVFTEDGRETIVWSGTDPTPAGAGGGVSRIDFDVSFPVDELKLTIDSPSVRGWNEIDAVALVDHTGTRHWRSTSP